MQPGVAHQYLQEVSTSFEQYAAANYVEPMCDSTTDADLRLGGVRYVATRRVPDQEWCLREMLTFPAPRQVRREIETAITDALLKTTADEASTARFLVGQWRDARESSKSRLYEDALRELGPRGVDAVLDALDATGDPRRTRRLAQLLVRLTRIQPPEPVGRWDEADAGYRARVLEAWRLHLIAAGKASPPPEPEPEPAPDAPDEPPSDP